MIQDTPSAVPRLATALTGPLQELERHFLADPGQDTFRTRVDNGAVAAAGEQRRVLEPPVYELKTTGSRQ